ncbi:MAG: hypothetical protein WAM91_15515 [Candidatus Acidiferrales bacterium]
MDKTELVKQLILTANHLKPFADAAPLGARVWNGVEYAKVKEGEEKESDPTAFKWWSTLNTFANLIEAQSTPLSDRQISYIQRELFGGMGSLIDECHDELKIGGFADKTIDLFNCFRK